MKTLKEMIKYHIKQKNVAILRPEKVNDLIYIFDKTFFKLNKKEDEFHLMKGMLAEMGKWVIDNDSILLFNEQMNSVELALTLDKIRKEELEYYKKHLPELKSRY